MLIIVFHFNINKYINGFGTVICRHGYSNFMADSLSLTVYETKIMAHNVWEHNLPASNRLLNIRSSNVPDLLLKQRKLFPYIFIAMSLLGALPAIYFAGSHKRRTQGMRFSSDFDVIHTFIGIMKLV